jgi:hypothetical protein
MFQQCLMFPLNDFEPADSAADVNAHPLRVLFGDFKARHRYSVDRSCDTQLDKAPHLLDVFLFNKTRGLEMLDLAADPRIEIRSIE